MRIASEVRHCHFAMVRYRAPVGNGWERFEPLRENESVTLWVGFSLSPKKGEGKWLVQRSLNEHGKKTGATNK